MGDSFMAYHTYILLGIFILLVRFRSVSYRRKLIKNALLKRLVNVFTIIAIVFIAFAVVLFPDLGSVKTTGEYSYTSHVLELTDTSRLEDYKSDGGPHKLSVLIYYPDADGIENNTCPLVVFLTVVFQRKQAIFHFIKSLQVTAMWLSVLIIPITSSVQKSKARKYT